MLSLNFFILSFLLHHDKAFKCFIVSNHLSAKDLLFYCRTCVNNTVTSGSLFPLVSACVLWAVGGCTMLHMSLLLSPSCTTRLFLSILLCQAGNPSCKLRAGITSFSSLCSSHTSAHPGLFLLFPGCFVYIVPKQQDWSMSTELMCYSQCLCHQEPYLFLKQQDSPPSKLFITFLLPLKTIWVSSLCRRCAWGRFP